MIIRALDSDGDWTYGKGRGSYLIEVEAIAQEVKTKILEWKGDCYFNITAGVDWINRIGQKSLAYLESDIRNVIIKSRGVTKVENIDIDFDSTTRNVSIRYSIQTVFSKSVQDIVNQSI